MFRILWDPSSGSINRASLKLLVMFCVRSRCLAAWNLDLWRVCLVSRTGHCQCYGCILYTLTQCTAHTPHRTQYAAV